MSKKYQLAVFVGRMAPLHHAHLKNIQTAASVAERVLVILGSANATRDEKNPFTNDQRYDMVKLATANLGVTVHIEFMNDMPSNDLWAASIMACAQKYEHPKRAFNVALVGHKKDESSFYLDLFPTWDFIETGVTKFGDDEMAATTIRSLIFEDEFESAKEMMDTPVWEYVNREFIGSELFKAIQEEYFFHISYAAKLRNYPINSVTVDAVVLCEGHILLIRRKHVPGKGKKALPGGFLNLNETIEDGMLRELEEETKLHVPLRTLRKSIIDRTVFDKPGRSLRGRIITHAHTIRIDKNNDGSLPRVYGADDADKAYWEPIANIMAPENAVDFFEDHHNIIMTMIGRAAKQNQ